MSYNGTGTFNINTAGQPVVTGTTITSTAFNLLTADLASGLTTAITKDGQTTPTANIPMGGFKVTGLGAGSSATDAAQYGQLQAGATIIATVSGTDTLTGSLTPAISAYATGNLFSFVAANSNTGATTINLNSLGAKSITKQGSTALAAGDIVGGQVYLIEYDGTRFQLINPSGLGVSSISFGSTGLTPSTATGGVVNVAGTLAIANGGTNSTATPTAGAVVYGNGTAHAMTAVGTAGQVLVSAGSSAPTWGSTVSFQEFTSSGTWTKPSGATFVMVETWGGGGGGGSGRRGAASSTRMGGAGGGGGAYTQRLFKASDLSSTVSVTIAAGGTGAASITTDSTNGSNGGNGGNTTFGAYLTAFGGGGAKGGVTVNSVQGGQGGGALSAANIYTTPGQPWAGEVDNSRISGHFGGPIAFIYGSLPSGWGGASGGLGVDDGSAYPGGCSYQGGPGGGGGATILNTNTVGVASAGGSFLGAQGGGGAAGTSGGAGTAGSGRQGGGGGSTALAAAGGAGGAGGTAAGGGGGGGSTNSYASGAGAAGGAGLCRVYTW